MGVLLALVTPNPPRVQFAPGQLVIQQHARARATLAIDELDIVTREILEAGDSTRIASWNDQPLDSSGELDEYHALTGEVSLDVTDVVFAALFVEQVRARQVCLAARQSQQSTQTAHVRRRQRRARRPPG